MFINSAALILALLTGASRLGEITLGEKNAKEMLKDGGKEFASYQRWPIFIIYTLWLILLPLLSFKFGIDAPLSTEPQFLPLIIFCVLEMLRWWAIAHLGKFWTTRVIVIPNAKRIITGPYRFLPHPIYIALWGEVIALSLTFQQSILALFFGGLTGLWILWRIKAENSALKHMA